MGFRIRITAEHFLARIPQSPFQHVAIIGHAHRVTAMRAPLNQIDKLALGFELRDVFKRFSGFPIRRIGACIRQIFTHVALLDRREHCIGRNFFLGSELRHVALSIVAGQPAPLLAESGHLAVVDHDGHAVFIDTGLLAFLHHFIQLRETPDLPLLAVIAQVLMLGSRISIVGLPLKAQIQILCVVGRLYTQIDVTILACDRHRFERAAFDEFLADILLGVLFVVTGNTRIAALDFLAGTFVRVAA